MTVFIWGPLFLVFQSKDVLFAISKIFSPVETTKFVKWSSSSLNMLELIWIKLHITYKRQKQIELP